MHPTLVGRCCWVRAGHHIPGALRSLRELSLVLPLGLVTRRPPTYVGSRDRVPTALAAPHSCHRIFHAARRNEGRVAGGGVGAPRRARSRLSRTGLAPDRGSRAGLAPQVSIGAGLAVLADPQRNRHSAAV